MEPTEPYPDPDDAEPGFAPEPERYGYPADHTNVPGPELAEPPPVSAYEPVHVEPEPIRRHARPVRNGAGLGQRLAGHLGGEPRQRPSSERAFRIIEIRHGSGGDLVAQLRRELIATVYRGGTAMRLTKHEAKLMAPDEAVLLLVRPTGGFAGVWMSGSGRRASSRIAGKCKRLVREMMPELFSKRRRRTSRGRSGAKKRTSRRGRSAARAARRTSRGKRRRSARRR